MSALKLLWWRTAGVCGQAGAKICSFPIWRRANLMLRDAGLVAESADSESLWRWYCSRNRPQSPCSTKICLCNAYR